MSSICFLVTSKGVVQGAPDKNNLKKQKEIMYLDRQIQKADLEILLLERQLRWVHCHGETSEYVNVWNYITNPDCCFCTFRE